MDFMRALRSEKSVDQKMRKSIDEISKGGDSIENLQNRKSSSSNLLAEPSFYSKDVERYTRRFNSILGIEKQKKEKEVKIYQELNNSEQMLKE
jgi:hypothetical protein